jgi:hypothetical protein
MFCMTERVRRVVLVLHRHKPLVIRPVGGFDALRSLVGLQADLVDVIAARGPVVKGRITSASSRVRGTFTSFAALRGNNGKASISVSIALTWPLIDSKSNSAFPAGLAQSLEHMGVIFRAVPGHALAHIHVERGRGDRDSPV